MQTLLSSTPNAPLRLSRFLGSVAAHAAIFCTAVVLSRYVVAEDEDMDWSRFRVGALRLHESAPVFFVPHMVAAASLAGRSIPGHGGKVGPTVLEPDYRPQARLPRSVPPLAHWSRMPPPDATKPDERSILTPGRAEAPPPQPNLSSPPNLSVPNRETMAGALNLAAASANSEPRSKKTVAPSSTQPIQTAVSGPAPAASFDPSVGQPVNVLAFSVNRSRQDVVEIDRGLQNLSGFNSAEGGGATAGNLVSTDGNNATSPVISASSARTNNHSERVPPGVEPANALNSARSPSDLAQTGWKRVNHPANGSYDVVVTQSAAVHDSLAGAMKGTGAVYTVYLGVGDDSEWALEFRSVASTRPPESAVQITIGDDDSITPPYPIVTVIPNSLLTSLSTALAIEGSITNDGTLSNLRLDGPASLVGERILELLGQWRFRPARQNRVPVEVAVRLIVPPRS